MWNCISSFEISDEGLHFVVVLDENGDKYITIAGYNGSSTNVIIPSSINVNGEDIPVKTIADNAFYNSKTIISVTIPDSVTTIGYSAFGSCYNLTTVTISEGSQLTSIGSSAFGGCSSLTSIYIPNSVTTIGYSAFGGCSSLTSIYIPDSVTTIGEYAFSYCSSLTSIYIPDSVTTIGEYVFYYCFNLRIYCEASSKPSGWNLNWNSSNRPVVWNCTYDEYLETIA